MKIEIRKCPKCQEYTLKSLCEKCRSVTITIKPAKYSPEDKYGHYRRLAKKALSQNLYKLDKVIIKNV